MTRTYTELKNFSSFFDRYRYLKLGDRVGKETFGAERYFNQVFYKSPLWRKVRSDIIVRDRGMDLAFDGRPIGGMVYVHHLNPITIEQIKDRDPILVNPEYLVCCSLNTHNAIHYGDESLLIPDYTERTLNDTIPWK